MRVPGEPGGPAQAAAVPSDPGHALSRARGDVVERARVELEADVGVVVERFEECAVEVELGVVGCRRHGVNPGMCRGGDGLGFSP